MWQSFYRFKVSWILSSLKKQMFCIIVYCLFQTVLSGDVWTVISMSIDLHNVTLEFLKSHDLNPSKEESLAKLDFIRSRLSYDAFSDQSKETDLVSHEILVCDTRFQGMQHSYGLTVQK